MLNIYFINSVSFGCCNYDMALTSSLKLMFCIFILHFHLEELLDNRQNTRQNKVRDSNLSGSGDS